MGKIIEGRPDLDEDLNFGVTRAKSHPKYVYSNQGGLVLHEIAYVRLSWYDAHFDYLERRDSPSVGIITKCGQFFSGDRKRKDGGPKSISCNLPKPEAVPCGRCSGGPPVFGKQWKEGVPRITRLEAKARLGCIVEVD